MIPLLMNLGMFGGDIPPTPDITTQAVGGGVRKRKERAFRLSELTDGDRRSTAEFLKAHIAQTPERIAFTQAPMPKASVLTDKADENIIAVILASEL